MSRVTISSSAQANKHVIFAERKGIGHPDTLADHLAERLSRAYSTYTKEKFGAVLHHNFDKLGILGGRSVVEFQGGKMISPVRVLVNGRISAVFADQEIDYKSLLENEIYDFFFEIFEDLLPRDMIRIQFNLSNGSSPGHVSANEESGSARNYWFKPRDLNDLPELKRLFSNDTSIGSGYYPLDVLESFIVDLEKKITSGKFKNDNPWLGSDVKVVGGRIGKNIDITICIPQVSKYVKSIQDYKRNIKSCLDHLEAMAASELTGYSCKFHINTRDDYEKGELYLTVTGSSIESGDEGLVGRGNRVNEVISVNNTMSIEGASGKNPVYHVGKIYYIAAHNIAKALYGKYGFFCEVFLVSQSGRRLEDPWKIVVNIDENIKLSGDRINTIRKDVAAICEKMPDITKELLDGKIILS